MHATPESFRLNQSPLVADLPAPGSHMRRNEPPRGWNKPLRPRDGKTFQRLSASWSTTMKPHGSRAGYEPLRTRYAGSAPRMLGVHQPLTVEAGQSPPNKSPGSQSQVQQPFIPRKSRTADILLAIPGRRETNAAQKRGSQRRDRTR